MRTFNKHERLCGRKNIDHLFQKGRRFKTKRFLVIWENSIKEQEFPAKILISIPKRIIVKSSERNYLKRVVKEIYRNEKQDFYTTLNAKLRKIHFAIIYLENVRISFNELNAEIKLILNRLKN